MTGTTMHFQTLGVSSARLQATRNRSRAVANRYKILQNATVSRAANELSPSKAAGWRLALLQRYSTICRRPARWQRLNPRLKVFGPVLAQTAQFQISGALFYEAPATDSRNRNAQHLCHLTIVQKW